jgi:hydrogenase nickel incorporation protein HypA/HybF
VYTGQFRAQGAARVTAVGLRVGALSSVDPKALRFCIDTLKRGTPLDAVTLRIEWRSRFGCACAPTAIELEPLVGCCPTCGAMESYADTTALDIRFLQPDIEAA